MAYEANPFKNSDASKWVSSCVGEAMRDVSWEDFSKDGVCQGHVPAGNGQPSGDDDNQGGDDDAASVASGHSRWTAPSVAPSGRNWGW